MELERAAGEIVGIFHGGSLCGMVHEIGIEDKIRSETTYAINEYPGVRAKFAGLKIIEVRRERPLHEEIKQAHEDAAAQGEKNSGADPSRSARLTLYIAVG